MSSDLIAALVAFIAWAALGMSRKAKDVAICAILLLIAVPVVNATSILVLYTPHAVYFGSDSQISLIDGSEVRIGCKIRITNNFVWASAGILYETLGPFDVRTIARDTLKENTPFMKATSDFQDRITHEFRALLEREKASGAADKFNTSFVVAGIDDDEVLRASQIWLGPSLTASRRDCPSQDCHIGVFELGEHEAIDKILDQRHAIWKEMGIPEAIRYLIGEQQRATPRFVSGPVAILELSKQGVRWIEQGACK